MRDEGGKTFSTTARRFSSELLVVWRPLLDESCNNKRGPLILGWGCDGGGHRRADTKLNTLSAVLSLQMIKKQLLSEESIYFNSDANIKDMPGCDDNNRKYRLMTRSMALK